jgi:hypothetical protein
MPGCGFTATAEFGAAGWDIAALWANCSSIYVGTNVIPSHRKI